jgi:hypothetical protein
VFLPADREGNRQTRILALLSRWTSRDYLKLQLRIVAELLDGRGIDYPAIGGGNVTFWKARRTAEDQGEQLSL